LMIPQLMILRLPTNMMTMITSIRSATIPIINILLTLYQGTGCRFSRRDGYEHGIFERSSLVGTMSAVPGPKAPREGVFEEATGAARCVAYAAAVRRAEPAPGGPDA
ncbi:MAG: hypothetical protein V3U35_01795, partial [Candidatus Neomarinimicrobiota bacterium]